jgi:hypothetical protein
MVTGPILLPGSEKFSQGWKSVLKIFMDGMETAVQ